jgi:solute carrier family 25 protein 16
MIKSQQYLTRLVSEEAELKGTVRSMVLIAQKQGWKNLFSGLSINYIKVGRIIAH